MRYQIPRVLWGILIVVMTGVVAAALWKHPTSSAPKLAPIFTKVPSFQLIDQEGRPFSSDKLKSKVWVADFIFTSCAGVCPGMTHAMRRLQQELPQEIQLVSVSVDPARDTPSVLSSYARNFRADLRNWAFLTGSQGEIERLVREQLRLSLAEGESVEEPITHSVRFLLVDGENQIRGTFDGTDPAALEELKGAANALLREKG